MDELDNIQKKIEELLSNTDGKYLILEEEIDMDVQMKYFESSKLVKRTEECENTDYWEELYNSELSLNEVKNRLNIIAKIKDVKAFRFLERFVKSLDKEEFKGWALLALQESRMLIHTDLTQEDQFFISTGLGGKGKKLRYILILHTKGLKEFDPYQKDLLEGEMEHQLKRNSSELESFDFGKNYYHVKVLMPLQVNISDTVLKVIRECNEMGNFLSEDFLITNIKPLSKEEIEELLEKKYKDS